MSSHIALARVANLALTALLLCLAPSYTHAATPGIVNYQGRIQVNGADFPGASGQFKFALVSGAGTTTYWSNDNTSTSGNEPTAAVTLPISKGLYSVLLGDTQLTNMTSAIPATVFANSDVRLRVWFNDGTNGSQQLSPDQRIAAVGYALVAENVSGGTGTFQATATTQGVTCQASSNTYGGLFTSAFNQSALLCANNNVANTAQTFRAENFGLGQAGYFGIANANSPAPALNVTTIGNGPAIACDTTGTGGVLSVGVGNTNNSSTAFFVTHTGLGTAGSFSIQNANSNSTALSATSNGNVSTATFNSSGIGLAAIFTITNAAPNFTIFQLNSVNKIRFDSTGKGFFAGGTQTGGADVAETFPVIGSRSQYEPGDVLILSTSDAGKVEKSAAPYSALVSGVHATKPGVLLTERNIDADTSDLVPMGVVGVIPTKVCTENGPIKIGDLLVTSSTSGHAMKGTDRDKMMGAIIGKALENFDGAAPGKIKVLVNVK